MFNIYELFDSVGILIDAKLKELQLDRTLLATVIDISKRDNGIYGLSYDKTVFSANGADPSLEIGDLVYVGVPQGNYTNAYIISKRITELDDAKTAKNPL